MPNFPSIVPQLQIIDPIGTYGCQFDHRVVFDGACNTGTPGVITSATINFTIADIGKRIVLTGAGASGAQYAGTISSINSTTSANVSPSISTTISSVGLQVHTDDLASWTNLINDLNNSTYAGGIIMIRAAWTFANFTNRSGISGFLPTINKNIQFYGIAGGHSADIGDYTKVGGTCIAYAGTSIAPTAFSAVMTFIPTLGTTAQNLKQIILRDLWIDCRNGGQNGALKGVQFQSCVGMDISNVFIMDPTAIGMEFLVVGPGLSVPNAGALGEAKDCTRNTFRNISFRTLDNPNGVTTPALTTTSSVITLSATPQNITVASNTGFSSTGGYAWIMSSIGILILVNYTGTTGGTTITGITCSAFDAIYNYATVSGSNITNCSPNNACSILLDGDGVATTGANTCLNQFDTVIIEQGSVYGPAAIEFRNSDSNVMNNTVINGGSNSSTNSINRITRPGIRFNGHSTTGAHARNNQISSGSAGPGGCSSMALTSAGALLTEMSGPNYWNLYQLGNGEPIPFIESLTSSGTQGTAGSFLDWYPNGGLNIGSVSSTSTTTQSIASATTAVVAGTCVTIPPQGLQVGTLIRWRIPLSKTAAGTATRTISIRYGTTGSTSDGTIASVSVTPTAVADQGFYFIELGITALGTGTSGAAVGQVALVHNSASAAGLGTNATTMTMTGFNTTLPNSGSAFFTVVIATGTSEVLTILPPVVAECVQPSNP